MSDKIHLLHHGKTLCGFGHDTVPGEWPPGHRWAWAGDRDEYDQYDDRLCIECFEAPDPIKDEKILKALSSDEGKRALGEALGVPLRQALERNRMKPLCQVCVTRHTPDEPCWSKVMTPADPTK